MWLMRGVSEALNLNHTHIYQSGYRKDERIANAIIDEYPGRGSELSLEFLDFSHSASPYLAIFCHIVLCMSFLNRRLFYFCSNYERARFRVVQDNYT